MQLKKNNIPLTYVIKKSVYFLNATKKYSEAKQKYLTNQIRVMSVLGKHMYMDFFIVSMRHH